MDFDTDHVDTAIDHVIAGGVALTNYPQLCGAAGLPSGAVADFMTAFHHRCLHRGLPPLDALAVHANGPRRDFPDAVYFHLNHQPDPLADNISIGDKRDATTFWLHQIQTCKLWSIRTRRT